MALTLSERPFTFDSMIGQKGIIQEMKRRSRTLDFPPCMILEGASGCGKTTMACIIAALLSDPNPIVHDDGTKDPNPNSPACKAIIDTKFNRDVVFKDASGMSKEDILDLSNSLSLAPRFDGRKIVIIDEAQALSKAGKGATLTMLEKKRKDAFIILCTMDIESFDKAVKSRCAVYKFKSPSVNEIAEYLLGFTEKLGLPDTPEMEEFYSKGLFTLAENCEGSVRMALQNFERCVLGEFFTCEQIEREFGVISNDKLLTLIGRLFGKDMSVLADIKAFGAKEFFYKLYKTICGAYVFQKTGYIDEQWKTESAKKMGMHNLSSIISNLSAVAGQAYFDEDLFFVKLADSFFTNKVNEVQPTRPKRIPID